MGNAAFLLVAVLVSIVGSVLLWLRHRRPKTFMSSIDDFQREMRALSREQEEEQRNRLRPRLRPRDAGEAGPGLSERH